ncbi:sucrose synthase [Striga asiatica]|uniref:sucrose synthase n=1 Tax=Striga asiatica TaxID=4170 RepID=A0A5A7PTY1_STRAF|nr:sucrose synthase [Striga asiatica]
MANRVLSRVHSLRERLDDTLASHRDEIVLFLSRLESHGKGILKPHQLLAEFESIIQSGDAKGLQDHAFKQEAIVLPPWVALAIRLRPGVWEYIQVDVKALAMKELTVPEYLQFKEDLVDGPLNGNFVLELDFEPFTASFPKPTLTKWIGNGVEFLNRHLSAKMFHDRDSMTPLLDFLRSHHYKGKAEEYLSTLSLDTPYEDFEHKFQEIGLERGWGDKAVRVSEMISMLLDLLEAPDSCTLERFLGWVPMVFNVVILSPHGYFAQENVLGYPDTGGQVVYILDQVPALEREMVKRIKEQGLDIEPRILIVTRLLPDAVGTTCGQRLEKVFGTEHSHILRVPFRTEKGIVRKWISRFEVWPNMETFTEDVAKEITAELQTKPDLIIGNYSEGNLAASLLAHNFLASMTCGLPNFATVHGGPAEIIVHRKSGFHVDPYNGEEVAGVLVDFFEKCEADPAQWDAISVGGLKQIEEKCVLKDKSKPILFTMARLDRVKNLTGLVELYANCPRLRDLVNLVVVGGDRRKESKDLEERAEMKKMYDLIETHHLNGQFRWISSQMNRLRNGELYRCVADTRGAFVQPAFYEAFGLTVVEAMTCGLPTFATVHGGPAEIIVHGKSGFHIDPYNGEEVAGLDRREIRRYLEMFYALKFRKLAEAVPLAVDLGSAVRCIDVAGRYGCRMCGRGAKGVQRRGVRHAATASRAIPRRDGRAVSRRDGRRGVTAVKASSAGAWRALSRICSGVPSRDRAFSTVRSRTITQICFPQVLSLCTSILFVDGKVACQHAVISSTVVDSSSEEEEEDISVNVANNAKSESKATEQKPADGEQGNASKEKKSDAGNGKAVVPETESGSSDEDLISDDDDDSEAETSEKRPVESAINTPVPNKAEATPQRTDGKKNNVHVNTPYPSKPHDMVTFSEPNQQTQESVGSYFSCKSCHKIFVNEKSLESHSKAKHGGDSITSRAKGSRRFLESSTCTFSEPLSEQRKGLFGNGFLDWRTSAELQTKPDLIIGNYSEGNLAASLLAQNFLASMTCGLPNFATVHGGPAEIIVHRKSGFHVDPYNGEEVAGVLVDFFEKCEADPAQWDAISVGGLKQIEEKYTWQIYSDRLLTLAGVYGWPECTAEAVPLSVE